jgi:hypothetical protein
MEDRGLELIPNPTRLIEGLRDTGYEFNTAIADIIDNSIAANASKVDILVQLNIRGELRVSIADNGDGMSLADLTNAMRYGAQMRPNPASLGKYGLGLKTASTAFCRCLSVISRNSADSPPQMLTWDLDRVKQTGKWEIVHAGEPDRDGVRHLNKVAKDHSGTVVIWTKIDRLMRDYSKPGGKSAARALERKVDELRDHLALVYQRFLDPNDSRASDVFISLNGKQVSAFDPFAVGLSELAGKEDNFVVELSPGQTATFSVRAYVLPRREEFPDQETAKASRLSSDTQGIYIYRENRLIHDADWLGMFQKEPHFSLLRVEFSFDHKLDDAFQLDIKKSQIILNETLWTWLRDEFLPAPRRAANDRYRDGQRAKVGAASKGAHTSSNSSIAARAATAGDGVSLTVDDPASGKVTVTNSHGTVTLKLSVGTAARPGEVHVKAVDSIVDGLLFEPAVIDRQKAVQLNTSHPYYTKIYVPNFNKSVTIQGLDSLMWALCVAELKTTSKETINLFREMRYEVSRILRTLVEDLPEPKLDESV